MADVKSNALARLIDETETARGYSDGDVANWANRDGQRRLTTSDISNWRRNGMATVVPSKVTALADGLRLPVGIVAVAALRSAGIEVDTGPLQPEDAIKADHTLSERTRDILLNILATDRTSAPPQRPRRIKRDSDPSAKL